MIFEKTYSEKSLYEAILIAFVDDELLMSKYHIFSGTLIECANDTYLKIMDANDKYPLEWYVICDGIEPIGYCVTSKTYSFLYSFGINISHRTSDNMEEWFDKVKSLFVGSFTCGLWAKNERAIDFLLKNGMNIYDKNELEIHLKYN
jgi:hypothetical protein